MRRGPITCLAAHPSQDLVVTAGAGACLQGLGADSSLGLSASVNGRCGRLL